MQYIFNTSTKVTFQHLKITIYIFNWVSLYVVSQISVKLIAMKLFLLNGNAIFMLDFFYTITKIRFCTLSKRVKKFHS